MPSTELTDLLSPATLARIDNYALLARVAVEGFISGLHRSLYHGFGSEFFQYRSYAPGDDLKYLDWKVYARRDRFYTKIFQEETNANFCVILDASASMGYAGRRAPCSKLRYASMVAACLAYVAARQGDNVGFYAYSDTVLSAIPPGHRSGGLQRILPELYRLRAGGTAQHERVMNYVSESFRRRGMVVLISDLLEADAALPRILRRFRFARHDCLVVHVLDPDEQDFPFSDTTRFVDSEGAEELVTAPALARHAYLRGMNAFLERVRLACLEQQVDYLRVASTDNLGNILAAYLHDREGRV